jgi:hypothetical protein
MVNQKKTPFSNGVLSVVFLQQIIAVQNHRIFQNIDGF